jgi:hypothetical protein
VEVPGAIFDLHPSTYIPMADPLYIYVDVDDTLLTKADGKEAPNKKVVQHVCELHRQGALLYCWSTGGEDHARSAAQKLGIESCFTGFLHKPQVFIDDERADQWPHFVHISPDRLRSIEDYRIAVAQKKDAKK